MKSCTGLGAARVLVAGYYGAGNIGDEAVLAGLLEGLRFQGITKITVLSFNPAETARIHGVDAVLNGRRFEGLPALRKLASKSDLFILGGGGLLWDQNPHVAPYWLSKVACAMSARCPVVYYALGVDRLATRTAKLMAQVVSNRAKAITVRDLDSADALRAAGVSRPAITVTADPALLMPSLNYRDVGVDSADGKLKIGVSIRPVAGLDRFFPILVAALRKQARRNDVRYFLIPFDRREDVRVTERLQSELGVALAETLSPPLLPQEFAGLLAQFDGVIGMRLHSLILASSGGRPVFAISYARKVDSFVDLIGMKEFCCASDSRASQLLENALAEWFCRLPQIGENVKRRVATLRERAMVPAEVCATVISSR